MDWASFVLFSQRQVSFDRSELIHNPAAHRILTRIANFQTLPDCCKHSTPSLLLSTRMPHPSQRDVRFLVLKFQLYRLRRSSSLSPNRFGGFHRHACMQACRFGPAKSPVTCALPSNDRPKPTRCTLPTLYSKRLGAAITLIAQ